MDMNNSAGSLKKVSDMAVSTAMRAIQSGLKGPGEPPHWDNPSALFTALSTIDMIKLMDEAAVYRDTNLLACYTVLTYAMEYYPEVPELLQRLQKAKPTPLSKELAPILSIAAVRTRENLSLPRFTLDYITRIERCWEAVASSLQNVRLDKLQFPEGASQFTQLMQGIIGIFTAFTGLSATLLPPTKENKKLFIAFSLDNYKADYYAIHYVIEHMPPSLQDKVVPAFGDPSEPSDDIGALTHRYHILRDTRFVLQECPGHLGILVTAYGPDLKGLNAKGIASAKAEINGGLIGLLGRDAWNLVIANVTILNKPRAPENAIFLGQVRQAIQDMGYPLDVSDKAFMGAMARQFTAAPSNTPALRGDTLTGSTMMYYLQADYETHRTNTADRIINLGVVPCFLAWPLSILPDGDADALDSRLVSYLEEHEKLAPSYQIIGRATGTQYYYMDMLVWSLPTLIRDVETFFAEIPGGDQVILQCFRYGSKPGPATMERLERFSDTSGEKNPASQQNAHKHPAKGNGKKKRKK